MSEGEHDPLDGMEARVRQVQHLEPFSLVRHPDGRFTAELDRSVTELSPEAAREIVAEMEPILRQLRERAGD